MGMAPVHDDVDVVETSFKEGLIGFEFERVRHDTRCIRKHSVLGNNGISLDTTWKC